MKKLFALAIVALTFVAGCTTQSDVPEEPADLGSFRLGHNIVVADKAQKVPPSRDATAEDWEAAITTEIDRRFSGYTGEGLFHIGVFVDGYSLAIPGIPVVLSPKSALIVTVNVFDDAQADNGRNGRLTEEAKQIVVLESVSGKTLFGSGLTQSKEKQIQNLSFNVARLIENWMLENYDAWLVPPIEPETDSDELADTAISVDETVN